MFFIITQPPTVFFLITIKISNKIYSFLLSRDKILEMKNFFVLNSQDIENLSKLFFYLVNSAILNM